MNLVSTVKDPPLLKFIGLSENRGVCHGQELIKASKKLVPAKLFETHEVLDYMSQERIVLLTSDNGTLIVDSEGKHKRFKGSKETFLHRMSIYD